MRALFRTTLLIVFLLTFSAFNLAEAQSFQLYNDNDIIVETIPEIPGPNEQVSIKLNSFSFNLNNYYIAWFENGEQRSADYGNREYSFRTGDSGSITDITAVIEVGNQVFRRELRFSPSEVDLLWEVADAYTPPFYKGKALPIRQSSIRVTAIPETQLIAPTDAPSLIYYWDNNFERDAARSGFGRQSYTFTADALNVSERVSVTANDRRENSFARNTITLPTNEHEPEILFYETDDNDRILTHRELSTRPVINGDTIKMSFHPLNISSVEPNFIDLFVQWRVNNEVRPPQNFEKQNELHISSGGQSGSVPISVTLESIEKLLQKQTENLNIVFGNQ
jgi:hypothetical protein